MTGPTSRARARREARLLAAALWLVAAWGCGSEAPADQNIVVEGVRDGRFAVDVTADGGRPEGQLRVSVEPRPGWHLALEAPARLELASSERLRFEPEQQTHEDAARVGEDGLAFEFAYADAADGELPVEARIKFGMCKDEAEQCEIVRRDLSFHLP